MSEVNVREAAMEVEDARDDDAELLHREMTEDLLYEAEMFRRCISIRDEDDEEFVRSRMRKTHHRPECTTITCFCFDQGLGDPMCECGHAGCDCRCSDLPENQLGDDPVNDDPYDDFLAADGFAHPWDGEEPSR